MRQEKSLVVRRNIHMLSLHVHSQGVFGWGGDSTDWALVATVYYVVCFYVRQHVMSVGRLVATLKTSPDTGPLLTWILHPRTFRV